MDPITTALVGYGFSATTFHLPFITVLNSFELSAISSRQCGRVQAEHPGVAWYPCAEQMIRQCDAELVIITAPNKYHFPLARLALEQGKHVILEKPFVCTVEEGEHLVALAEEQKRLLSVYHNRRWDGDFLTLQALLGEGRLGEVRRFESRFDRFRPQVRERWREQPGKGAGIWFDLGPHLVDQALQLFGLPRQVSGRCRALREGSQVVDYFQVQLYYDRLEVLLQSSPYCAGPNLRFQLQGSLGEYRKQGLDPQEQRLIAGTKPVSEDWGQESAESFGAFYGADGKAQVIATTCGGYQNYFRQIASALRDGGKNPVPAEQALTVMRILELAQRSSEQGRVLTVKPEAPARRG
ncbi:oxidoreductase [Aestuariirhabdus sp. Z084]|uniref:oxidoreductase n=1 Tax=Aestuariirhabdus haliotis TaxID=2918751 RepID=UPI0020BF51DE|nr:oxidoreductase [Aestuariirhabdus haliotis]MCL6417071.1 oxidoreductase [Aestuariirhabdus haliotis]